MIIMIDHNDSFTYNLVHYFEDEGKQIKVIPHDQADFNTVSTYIPEAIVLSPGPGHPKDALNSIKIVEEFKNKIPILGVCLGFQMIVHFFKGEIIEGIQPIHGQTDMIEHDGLTIYNQLSNPTQVTRYHSLIADIKQFPKELIVTSRNEQGIIMSCRHVTLPIEGVQFHPEAILTTEGRKMIRNFIKFYLND